jgi:hypothetical protein
MHSNLMSEEIAAFFEEANTIQWKKNADYHPDRVAFLEILRTAAETGITVEQDLWAKIRKQYIALRGYAIDGRAESEPPRQRMIDIAVYMGMFAFWDRHKLEIVSDALHFARTDPKMSCELMGRPDRRCSRPLTEEERLNVMARERMLGYLHFDREYERKRLNALPPICDNCRFLFWLEDRAS